MSRDAENVGRCRTCGDRRPLTEGGYCNEDCAPCGCNESVALRAEVERLRGALEEIASDGCEEDCDPHSPDPCQPCRARSALSPTGGGVGK